VTASLARLERTGRFIGIRLFSAALASCGGSKSAMPARDKAGAEIYY